MQSLLRPRLVCGPLWSAKTGSDVSLARVTGTHTASVGDHRRVPKSLPEFCRSQLCTVVHGHAVCNGRDRKKQRKFKNLGAESANQGVVGSSPAGRAKFQGLGSENQVLLQAVGPLWDLLSTGPRGVDGIQALGVQNQVLLCCCGTVWDLQSPCPRRPSATRNTVRVPLRSRSRFAC